MILIPEIPYDLDSICTNLTERRRRGKWFSIVAVAEGAVPKEGALGQLAPALVTVPTGKNGKRGKKKKKHEKRFGKNGAADSKVVDGMAVSLPASTVVARAISQRLGIETRVAVLGHLQRGGSPTPCDRLLATRFGSFAAEMLAKGVYNRMVCLKGSDVTSVPIEQVAGKLKLVPPDHPLLRAARRVGTNFGD